MKVLLTLDALGQVYMSMCWAATTLAYFSTFPIMMETAAFEIITQYTSSLSVKAKKIPVL